MSLLIYPDRTESGVENMATDWWLFKNSNHPSIRHYKWIKEVVSFGYGQDWRWVEQKTGESINDMIRRPTGGGIVKHGHDWTYSVVLPKEHLSIKISPLDLYKGMHESIGAALREQNIDSHLQPCPSRKEKVIPGDCFLEPVGWDLIDQSTGYKIAGAAMKRSREGMLIQGTVAVQKNWNLKSGKFYDSIIYTFCNFIGETKISPQEWPTDFLELRENFKKTFSNLSWKRDRKNS